jgi:putative RNA 2'-phosphotransferase
MDKRRRQFVEKVLFSMLGKVPCSFLVVLDDGGWLSVKEIHKALQDVDGCGFLTPALIKQFIDVYRPDRFETDGKRIRVKPEYRSPSVLVTEYAPPPHLLYLPVRPKAHAHVLKKGLMPPSGKRWIVLLENKADAERLGKRRDSSPVIGKICGSAEERGACFFRTSGGLYLIDRIEPEWIELPPLPEDTDETIGKEARKSKDREKGKGKGKEAAGKAVTPGSFFPSAPPDFSGRPSSFGKRRKRSGRKDEPAWKKERRRSGRYR